MSKKVDQKIFTHNLPHVLPTIWGQPYKSVPVLGLIISQFARYLPKPVLNNIPSLCVKYGLYWCHNDNTGKISHTFLLYNA